MVEVSMSERHNYHSTVSHIFILTIVLNDHILTATTLRFETKEMSLMEGVGRGGGHAKFTFCFFCLCITC